MSKKTVLVVDNHPVMLKFMTELLEKRGHRVLTAQDGLSALEILQEQSPDVAFIDLVMPNISGDKLCRIIRGMPTQKDIRLIVLSAIATEQTDDFTEFGADACIAKGPLDETAKHVISAIKHCDQPVPQPKPDHIVGAENVNLREITKELLSVKRHLEAILISIPEGIVETNLEGRIVYANQSALRLIDIPEAKLLGSYFTEMFQQAHRDKIQDLLSRQCINPEATLKEIPCPMNGREIALRFLPVRCEEGKIIVVLKDITEKKRLEAQLLQAQKMEAIGTLAGGIAHDFNNLLMTIQGNVSLMLIHLDPANPNYERLVSIEKQVESGAKLGSQLLGYARKGKYEVKPLNLNQLVGETADAFGRTRKQVPIDKELTTDLCTIEADEGQIHQLLLNLFVNAADAMPDGGRLILRTQNATHEEIKDKPYNVKPGNYVLLTVTDTGVGMDRGIQDRIFEPFFTTKEMGRGTGLGLASAYGVTKSHGGYIDVVSDKGKGTTFRIFLPSSDKCAPIPGTPAPMPVNKDDRIICGTETILLIDDEVSVLRMEVAMLEELGYRVIEARNGADAIDTYSANKDAIDLVILDMIMPEISGGQVYDIIKETNQNVKVLLASGYSREGRASKILERGCDGFLQKPFDVANLSHVVRQVLDKIPEK